MTRNYTNNFLDTTIADAGGISASAATLTLTAAVPADLAVPFSLTLEPDSTSGYEIVLVSALDSTRTVCTLGTRGADGTTAKAHSSGVAVRHCAIAADFADLQAADASEATARASADASEASARAAADTSEATSRASADAAHASLTTSTHGGIVAASDGRLSDARTPTAHHTSHEAGGSDVVAHQSLSGAGTNTHAQIDSHIANTSNPHATTAAQVGALTQTQGDARYWPLALDLATQAELDAAIAAHLAASNPHPQYARLAAANTFTLGLNLFRAGADGNVALAARRHSAGATEDIFQIQDETGDRLIYVEPDGSLWIVNTFTEGNGTYTSEHALDVTATANYQTGNDYDQELVGLKFLVQSAPTNVPILSDLIGVYGVVKHQANQELPVAWGGYYTVINDGPGTIDFANPVYTQIVNWGGGHIGEGRGAWIDSPYISGGSTIDRNAGLYISSQTDPGITEAFSIYTNDGPLRFGDYIELPEITAPLAPAVNTGRLFVRDNGSGKSQLAIRFPSGAIQTIATEP